MKPAYLLLALAVTVLLVWAFDVARDEAPRSGGSTMTAPDQDDTTPATPAADATPPDAAETEPATKFATFGAGCFWCVEAVFEELEGVVSVESGYSNGHTENPTYKQVCSGTTGYNEVTRIEYDPKRVSFAKLLEVFWKTHDPTTLNRQGADVGTQYRSGVYYHDDEQKRIAEELKQKLDESGAFSAPIVTEILAVERYVPAEAYHQDYYAQNPNQGYCRAVIAPKLDKFRKTFADYLKR